MKIGVLSPLILWGQGGQEEEEREGGSNNLQYEAAAKIDWKGVRRNR